jgi:hypothetical protein
MFTWNNANAYTGTFLMAGGETVIRFGFIAPTLAGTNAVAGNLICSGLITGTFSVPVNEYSGTGCTW